MIKLIRMFLLFVVVPFALGLPFSVKEIKRNLINIIKAYLIGFFALIASFEIVCVPFVLMGRKFSSFMTVYDILLTVMTVAGIAVSVIKSKKCKSEEKEILPAEKKHAWILWMVIVILVLLQVGYVYTHAHYDGDDAYFVAQSELIDTYDQMFMRNSYTGTYTLNNIDMRHALSTVTVFVTWLARGCDVQPAVMAHSILAAFLLVITYMIYCLWGELLFEKKSRLMAPIFVLVLMLWNLFSNVSLYTAETFIYTRTWQGKAIFGSIVVPVILYELFLYEREKDKNKKSHLTALILLSVCGLFCTTISVFLIPILYGTAAIILWIREKNFKTSKGLMFAMIPSIVFGVMYFFLKYLLVLKV